MKKIFILFLLIFYFVPATSFGTEVFFSTDNNGFFVNEDFLVKVYVDTEDTTVNALEGSILFPSDVLELKEVRDANSSINFWLENPRNLRDGQVNFSGITAGGFNGEKKFLFGMIFKPKKMGDAILSLSDLQVLLNDGIGTKAPVENTPLTISVLDKRDNSQSTDLRIVDNEIPEDFNPLVAKDPSLFDGKYFVVFSTVDKGVGIDHYEVREGLWGDYVATQSPHLLKDQSLSKNIYIKAIDKSGNKRIVEIKGRDVDERFQLGFAFVIILIICLFFLRKIYLKFSK
ncbi:MAG: cohesin domain-containing protein [Patescibacteria group bacterium]